MKTLSTLLREADPLRHEPDPLERERHRLRHTVVSAGSAVKARSPRWRRTPVAVLAAVAALVCLVVVGIQIWPLEAAAIQFEVRLAEEHPAEGLREARVAGSGRLIYLHPAVIVTNDDIAESALVEGDRPSRHGVVVRFTPAGGRQLEQATAGHIGKPMAILLDGEVAAAPVVRSRISVSALLSGDYTRADAERIANGIRRR
jgi:hypothetical protein